MPEHAQKQQSQSIQQDLPAALRTQLLATARQAAQNAYAPFSDFQVGAAVLTHSGEVVSGCNVENSSYGLSNCAERTAIFSAVAQGLLAADKAIKVIAVTCVKAVAADLCDRSPCGACRQVMKEFSDHETLVLIDDGEAGQVFTMEQILPYGFKFA